MSINLITDPWLPVRRLSGERSFVRPADITSHFADDPILALDFPRPDWNAAVTELLIGLLACVMAPEDNDAWADLWMKPPLLEELAAKLAPLAFAFNLGGDGSRCFQDHEGLPDGDPTPVSALLMDAPSEDSSSNTDLFIKQGQVPALCPNYAAAALITMQNFAPEGGRGHLASMRGGGPLLTLILPRRSVGAHGSIHGAITTLWDVLWANTPSANWVGAVPEHGDRPAWALIVPWLAKTRTSTKGGTIPDGDMAHKLQSFFGLPRRIHLDVSPRNNEHCALDGPAHDHLVRTYRRRPQGVKYQGWEHPLTPYRVDPAAGKLPFHPQPGTGTFRDWLVWVEKPRDQLTAVADCVGAWDERLKRLRSRNASLPVGDEKNPWQSGLLACGFDMKKMKARGWLEARIPYFDPPPEAPSDWSQHFMATARQLVAGADAAARALRYRLQLAKFGQLDTENGTYSLPKTSPGKEAFQEIHEFYWRETETDFLAAMADLRTRGVDPAIAQPVRKTFLNALRRKALELFDTTAGTDDLSDQDARRIVDARWRLGLAFGPTGDVRKALDLVAAENQGPPRRGSGNRRNG